MDGQGVDVRGARRVTAWLGQPGPPQPPGLWCGPGPCRCVAAGRGRRARWSGQPRPPTTTRPGWSGGKRWGRSARSRRRPGPPRRGSLRSAGFIWTMALLVEVWWRTRPLVAAPTRGGVHRSAPAPPHAVCSGRALWSVELCCPPATRVFRRLRRGRHPQVICMSTYISSDRTSTCLRPRGLSRACRRSPPRAARPHG